LKRIIRNIGNQTRETTRKATKSVKDTASVVGKNKTKYISIVVLAIVLPGGTILGPITLVEEIRKDKKKQAGSKKK